MLNTYLYIVAVPLNKGVMFPFSRKVHTANLPLLGMGRWKGVFAMQSGSATGNEIFLENIVEIPKQIILQHL